MSYPEPRYHGEGGEVSAVLRPAAASADVRNMPSNDVHYLATSATTHDEFGLYRWDFGPKQSGPDPHFHRSISESFFVLSGSVSLYDGNRWVDAGPGDFLYVPQGGIHGFKNVSGQPASMLLLFTPGAPREEYFETLAEVAQGRTLTDDERTELFLRHDNHWL
jgi:mannose-6-phosphate isomerase-like protein (cupin superfamily)